MEEYRNLKPWEVGESRFFFKLKYWYKWRQTLLWQRAVCLHRISWASACSRHLSTEQILLLDGCWSQELKHNSHDELHQRNSAGTGHIYLLLLSLSHCLHFLAQWTKTCWKGCKKFLPLLSAEAPLIFFSLQRHKWKFRKEWVSEKAKRFIYRAADPVLDTRVLHSTESNKTDFIFFCLVLCMAALLTDIIWHGTDLSGTI